MAPSGPSTHGHFAFWGAFGCGVIAVLYLALAKSRGCDEVDSSPWKWSFALLNVGMLGMVGALLVAGIDQAFFNGPSVVPLGTRI